MRVFQKIKSLLGKNRLEAEMAEEMRLHLEHREQEKVAAGMSPEEARYAALRQFGNVSGVQEEARDARGGVWLEQFRQDAGYAVRSLRRTPGFSIFAALILALGIGSSTAVFSVIYGVLLEPYPYARSNEIWAPRLTDKKNGNDSRFDVGDYLKMSRLSGVAQAMATSGDGMNITGAPYPDRIWAVRVSGTAFPFLGVPPVLGRGLVPSDVRANGEAEPVAVLAFQFWQSRFNGDPAIVGRTIKLNDLPYTIVGVMPPRFGWFGTTLWLPLPTSDLTRWAIPVLRLKPGVSPQAVGQQLQALGQRLIHETPKRFPKDGVVASLTNYLDITVASGSMRASLLALVFAVGLLLLIACTNVANLQLARGSTRSREIAVRLALGASRGRLVRQLLTECVGLSVAGGVLGGFFAYALIQIIVALLPPFFVPNEARVTMNGWVFAFSAGISVLTGILFGLLPSLQCTRPALTEALKDGGQGAGTGPRGARTRNALVVVEVALSVVLLVCASVAVRSFTALFRHDWGFIPERLLILRVDLPPPRYPTIGQRSDFARDYLARLRNLPGVTSAAVGNLPFETGQPVDFRIPGHPQIQGGKLGGSLVSADFRTTFGLSLRAGRDLTEAEVAHGDPVALISEAMAKLWPASENPLGQTVEVDALADPGDVNNLAPSAPGKTVTVVGIVGDTRNANFRAEPPPAMYVPYTLRGFSRVEFMVRTAGLPLGLVPSARAALRDLDSELPIYNPITVEEIMGQQTVQPRFNMALFSGLAGLALALAAAGIYSVISYNLTQRTREIGLRMALGAEPGDILRLVFSGAGRLVGIGLGLGLAAALGLMAIIKSHVFDVPVLDPVAMAAAAFLLLAAALVACWWPARRAARVDPARALRAE